MSEKLSFKIPQSQREFVVEIDFNEDDKIELICSFPSVSEQRNKETTFLSMFKDIIRKTKDIDLVLEKIEKNMDENQFLELIMFINENLLLSKKKED